MPVKARAAGRGAKGTATKDYPDDQGQRVAVHVPVLTTNPKRSRQTKSPPIVKPISEPLNVHVLPSAKISGSKKIVTPSTPMTTVPKVAVSLPKQASEPGRQENTPETNSPEAQIVNAMSVIPSALVAVPSQRAGVPSGQKIGTSVTQKPSVQNWVPLHRSSTDGMVLVVVDEGGVASVVLVAVVVVVAGAGHVAPPHASQQLGRSPTQALPRCGALHAPAFRLMPHV